MIMLACPHFLGHVSTRTCTNMLEQSAVLLVSWYHSPRLLQFGHLLQKVTRGILNATCCTTLRAFSALLPQLQLFQNVAFKWHDMSLQLSALADCKYGPQLARPEHLVKSGCNNTNSVGETDAESLCCCKFPHTSTAVQQGLGTSQTSWT